MHEVIKSLTNLTKPLWPRDMEIARCFKITEKVSFNIANEASYTYILSEQKFNKSAKKI